jgi:hypothetical protein
MRMRSATTWLVALLLGVPAAARALPDLVPSIEEVTIETGQSVSSADVAEGCAGATTGRTLVRFGVRFRNVGVDPLALGDPLCPDCALNPGVVCADSRYVCSPSDGHGHPHFRDFARYELLDAAGNVLGLGGKRTFCARDDNCPTGTEPVYDCDFQGLTAGCDDYYFPSLGCQYVDATDVPDVGRRALRLRVVYDPNLSLPDANRANDVTDIALPGCGDGIVQDGEDCDPGPGATLPCCDTDCAFRDAAAECRPAAGECDAAERCDGESAVCPPNLPAPDGTACAAGALACTSAACVGGACATGLEPGWCLIDDACVAAGTPGPGVCTTCDPAQTPFGWSTAIGDDVDGIACRLGRVRVAAAACDARAAARVARRLDRLELRLAKAKPRGFFRACSRFARTARRLGCAADEAAALLAEARARADREAPRRARGR